MKQKYRFDNYVVGCSNEDAYNLCKQIADNPNESSSPVVIIGPYGTGKTHLINAMVNYINDWGNSAKYVDIDEIINMISKFEKEEGIYTWVGIQKLDYVYRIIDRVFEDRGSASLLAIDHVEKLVGNWEWQDLFEILVESLTNRFGVRVVMATERDFNELVWLGKRLERDTHLPELTIVRIDMACKELKADFVKRLAAEMSFTITDGGLEYLLVHNARGFDELRKIVYHLENLHLWKVLLE